MIPGGGANKSQGCGQSTPREVNTSRAVERDEKHEEQAGEEKRQKAEGAGEGNVKDLEEEVKLRRRPRQVTREKVRA